MSTHPSVEQAKTYLHAHLTHHPADTGVHGATDGPFVTISRESGTDGSTLAQLLATRLAADPGAEPWTVFDQDLVSQMLQEQHLPAHLARFLPEDKSPEIEAMVREIVGLHPNLWTLVQKTNLLIRRLAKHGHAIIVGRGARFAAASVDRGLHIRLVAPTERRQAVMMARLGVSPREAAERNRRVDSARRAYVRSVFDEDVAQPSVYDLVLNTGRFSRETLADLILPLVHRLVPAPATATEAR